MLPRLGATAVAMALLAIAPAVAQTAGQTGQAAPAVADPGAGSQVVTITQERLFQDSRAGQQIQDRYETASRALVAENRRIEAALEAEERDLTARRAQMPPEDFRPLAEAFDEKVEGIRAAQDAKSRALTRQRDEDRQRMLEAAAPILAQMMAERGAMVLIDKNAVVLSFDGIDITEDAVARLDAVLGEATGTPPEAPTPTP
ncbi:periplasmic chaperone for outer membrane proteins Skp [Cereibacter changlensis]|nr:periplasmic chaperone for outer membrane proteins Skp [Cereibacter changlensis]